jgi:CDGSH-type Zn-finger protein
MDKSIDGMPIVLTLEPGTYYRCTCRQSDTLPFCDGHHTAGGEVPLRFEVVERKRIALCGCGQSRNLPFCDGQCGVVTPEN